MIFSIDLSSVGTTILSQNKFPDTDVNVNAWMVLHEAEM